MKTRRDTLKLCLGTLAATSLAEAEPLVTPVASRIVDAHTHFYDPNRPQGVPWPAKDTPLYRPAYPKDWAVEASKAGVRETIVVECSKLLEDNDWILNLAAKEKSILGFVGRLMPGSTDFAKELKRLAANLLFRGVRPDNEAMLRNIATPEFVAGTRMLADMDLALDANGLDDLTLIATLADKVPNLRIVLDHVGNSGDPKALRPGWKEGISALAKRRNVFTKVSALVEFNGPEYGKAPTDPAYYLPVLNHVWEAFGDERLMFASNWPVSEKGAGYEALFKIVAEFFKTKGSDACEKFFWKNSQAAYKWVDRK